MTFSLLSRFHYKLLRFLNPAQKLLGEQNYILLVSILVGFLSGFAAVLMRCVESLCERASNGLSSGSLSMWLLPLMPSIGILFCVFVTYVIAGGHYERGLCGVIMGIQNRNGNVRLHKMFSHIITSGVGVGFGVSAGLEAPIALTGAAIGSNVARGLLLPQPRRILILACGSAAAISAMFNSPVAGAFFAIEIILPCSTNAIAALVPLILASAVSLVVSQQLMPAHDFAMPLMQWHIKAMPYYLLLGVASGLVSAFLIRVYIRICRFASKMKNPWLRALAGCIFIYVLFLLFPAVRGQGYNFINALLHGESATLVANSPLSFFLSSPWMFFLLVFLLVFLKAIASIVCLEAGSDGGIFAPSMCVGAFLGFAVYQFVHLSGLPWSDFISPINFLAIGMGGVLAGVMHAPLTGMFLIAELTGGYILLIPLMIVAAVSTYICRKVCPHNVYRTLIAEKGGDPDGRPDADALFDSTVGSVLEKDFLSLRERDSLRTLLKTVMSTHHNIFPVLNEEDRITGIVTLDSIRNYLLETSLYDLALAYDIKSPPQIVLNSTDSLGVAIEAFEKYNVSEIPVVRNGYYAGCITKDRAFDCYRHHIEKRLGFF